MKVAVIGGGPAAFGALARLVERKKAGEPLEIEVFSYGDENQEADIAAAYHERYSPSDINAILKAGKALGFGGALPPRSFNGQALQSHVGENGLKTEIKTSDTFGGIGNYWSGSAFPTHALSDPIGDLLEDLQDHYRFIAEQIPISGPGEDPLRAYFDDSHINNPPLSVSDGLAKLKCEPEAQGPGLAIGINRFALNTQPDHKNGCIQCGDCMYGCPRDALFRAAKSIDQFAQTGACRLTHEEVLKITSSDHGTELTTQSGTHSFDKVFVCAGALGSVDLMAQSFGAPSKPLYVYDNLLWYFPAISVWPRATRLRDQVFAFAELAGGIYDPTDKTYNHLLISTLPDAVMDNMLGRNGFSQALTRWFAHHLIIGAMYGSHDEYVRYRISQVGDAWKAVGIDKSVDAIPSGPFNLFKRHLAQHGWHTSRRLAMENGTSGHYSANLGEAYGIENLARTGAFDYNVFVCDSSSWNVASMSQQHTFTIMANASRIVQSAISSPAQT